MCQRQLVGVNVGGFGLARRFQAREDRERPTPAKGGVRPSKTVDVRTVIIVEVRSNGAHIQTNERPKEKHGSRKPGQTETPLEEATAQLAHGRVRLFSRPAVMGNVMLQGDFQRILAVDVSSAS